MLPSVSAPHREIGPKCKGARRRSIYHPVQTFQPILPGRIKYKEVKIVDGVERDMSFTNFFDALPESVETVSLKLPSSKNLFRS